MPAHPTKVTTPKPRVGRGTRGKGRTIKNLPKPRPRSMK